MPRTLRQMHRHRPAVGHLLAALATASLIASPAGPANGQGAKKSDDTRAPKPGTTCPALAETGRTAAGARVDCVKVGGAQQWQLRGSRPNPFAWGETALVVTEYATWRITVNSVDPDVTARVLAVDSRNKPPRAGARFVGLNLTLGYVGKQDSEMVRQGAILKAVGGPRGIERWSDGASTDDDCWANERVDKGATKQCMMPFEIADSNLAGLVFYAAKVVGTPVVYFSGTR